MKHIVAFIVGGFGLASSFGLVQSSTPQFQLCTIDGKKLSGTVQELSSQGSLYLGKSETRVDAGHWITLRRENMPLPASGSGPQVVLMNGDHVLLSKKVAVRLNESGLRIEPIPPLLVKDKAMTPPLSAMAVLWLAAPDSTEDPALFLRRLAASSPTKDIVLLRQGDRIEGETSLLDSDVGCQVTVGTQKVKVPWASIGAVVFKQRKAELRDLSIRHYHLILRDGGRLELTDAQLQNGAKTLVGRTWYGSNIQVPWTHVAALEVRGDPVTYLSDLQPSSFQHVPFLGPTWPLVRDGSVTGHALRLGESAFDKGLGTHAECRVAHNLNGNYSWFEACVGLDPDHGQRGRVKIRVLVDGKEREIGWNKELTARDQPLVLRLDVRNGKVLQLEVLCSEFGDVQAQVNWADARLIK